MSGTAVLFLVLVGGFVWGGFLTLALKAVRSESSKARARATAGSTGREGPAGDSGVRGPAGPAEGTGDDKGAWRDDEASGG